MSNEKTTAEADLTVFDMRNMLRLAVVEVKSYLNMHSSFISPKDKRYFTGQIDDDSKSQMVADAIAASMRNRKKLAEVRYV